MIQVSQLGLTGWLLVLVLAVIVIGVLFAVGALIYQVFFRLRTGGKRLAIIQARLDFPGEQIIDSSLENTEKGDVVTVSFRSGRTVRYKIARNEEAAIQLPNSK